MVDFSELMSEDGDKKGVIKIGSGFPPDLTAYKVNIPGKYEYLICDAVLAKGVSLQAEDQMWYSYYDGVGLLEIMAQMNAVYADICEHRDSIRREFNQIEGDAWAMAKKYNLGKVPNNKTFTMLAEAVFPSHFEAYRDASARLEQVNLVVSRVERSLTIVKEAIQIGRTRNANARFNT